MAKYKIIYDENVCVGTLNCIEAAIDFFGEDDNGYTILKGSVKNEETEKMELIIEGSGKEAAELAKSGCPSGAIEVIMIKD